MGNTKPPAPVKECKDLSKRVCNKKEGCTYYTTKDFTGCAVSKKCKDLSKKVCNKKEGCSFYNIKEVEKKFRGCEESLCAEDCSKHGNSKKCKQYGCKSHKNVCKPRWNDVKCDEGKR